MVNQKYLITDPDILKEGGLKSLGNAQNHSDASDTLSKNKQYGLATSHLILAAEEAIKAYELLAISAIGNKNEDNLKVLFRDHNVKLGLVQSLVVLDLLFGRITEALLWQFEYTEGKPTKEEYAAMKKIQEQKTEKLKEWLITQMEDDSEVAVHADWWRNANKLKKEGFYVDFDGSKWRSPKSFSKKDYKKAHKHVNYLIDKVQNLKSNFLENPEIFQNVYSKYLKSLS